jgi:hypothetical protein
VAPPTTQSMAMQAQGPLVRCFSAHSGLSRSGLQLHRVQNESPTPLQCRGNQHFRRPTAQLYGAGAFSSIVVDIRESQTDIAPIYAARRTNHRPHRHAPLRKLSLPRSLLTNERPSPPPSTRRAACVRYGRSSSACPLTASPPRARPRSRV